MNGITPIEQLELSKIAEVGQEYLSFDKVEKLSRDKYEQQLSLFQQTMLVAFSLDDSPRSPADLANNTHLHAKNMVFALARGVVKALNRALKVEHNLEIASCIYNAKIYVFISSNHENLSPELEAVLTLLVKGFYPIGDDPGVCESGIMLRDFKFRAHPLQAYVLGDRLEVGYIKKNSSMLREELVEMSISEIRPTKKGKFSAEIRSCISSTDETEISSVGKTNSFDIDRRFEDLLYLLALNNSTYQGMFHVEEYLDSRLFRLVICERQEQVFEKYVNQLTQVNLALKSDLGGLKSSPN